MNRNRRRDWKKNRNHEKPLFNRPRDKSNAIPITGSKLKKLKTILELGLNSKA